MSSLVSVPPDSLIGDEWPVSQSSTIYARECYEPIYDLCQQAWNKDCELVLLRGNPGVGKSFFLDFVLSRLLADHKDVMVLSGPRYAATLYCGYDQEPKRFSLVEAYRDKRAWKSEYILYDPQELPWETQKMSLSFFHGKKVLIALPPDPNYCSKIIRDAQVKTELYMGPTDLVEAEDMRQACYNDIVSAQEVQKRFELIGGAPRFLFRKKSPLPIKGWDDSVLREISDEQTLALKHNPSSFATCLFLMVPDELYTSHTIEFSGNNVRPLVLQRLLTLNVQTLWNLYFQESKSETTLRELYFEAYAHKKILVDGIDLMAKELNESGVSESRKIQVPSGSRKYILRGSSVNNIHAQCTRIGNRGRGYILPKFPNYEGLDSVYASPYGCCIIFQMAACGRSKPCSGKMITALEKMCKISIVVTPEENLVTENVSEAPAGMKQYVLVLQESASI